MQRARITFAYLSLITDAYSRKIVGHKLHKDLSRDGSIYALQTSLANLPEKQENIIHHSDRGVQYCSDEYVQILSSNLFEISMTENGDPLENAIAERVNGILKDEFNIDETFDDFGQAEQRVNQSIKIYNNIRPHSSIDNQTPAEVHGIQEGKMKKHWKNYYKNESNNSNSNT